MKRSVGPIGAILILPMLCLSQTQVETEPVKELRPTSSLGTCRYKPTAGEITFYQKLAPDERLTGSIISDYDIHQKEGFVSWYGIVRGISKVKDNQWSLLLEHKFFDGMTDCHIMLVDIGGSGDFRADFEAADVTIPALALVRVYGTIRGEEEGTPVLAAEFVRVWPWMTFTFSNLMSKDRTNPKWKDLRSVGRGRIYNPWPDEGYYRAILGDPKDAGLSLKDKR
jgi:hypothetical protein